MRNNSLIRIALISTLLPLAVLAEPIPPASPITPCVILTGAQSHVSERGYHRITSLEAWTEIWQKHQGLKPGEKYDLYFDPAGLPVVDFDRFMVIAIFQGSHWNSAGLKAVSISENLDRILFRFDDKAYQTHGEGKPATAYGFFVIPRSAKPVVLEENVQRLIGRPPVWKERITFLKTTSETTNSFGIYLTSQPVDRRLTAQGKGDWYSIRLSESPLISAADIVTYDPADHSLRLRPEALARIPRPPVEGTPFVVVAGGQRIYLGLFTTCDSSLSFAVPAIVVDRRILVTNQPPDTLVIDRAYPQASFGVGPDPRADERIKAALTDLHLLKDRD